VGAQVMSFDDEAALLQKWQEFFQIVGTYVLPDEKWLTCNRLTPM